MPSIENPFVVLGFILFILGAIGFAGMFLGWG